MKFIELNEWVYKNGGYITYPVSCNIEEISNVQECDGGYSPDYCLVTMRNGKSFKVREKYRDIISRINKGDTT